MATGDDAEASAGPDQAVGGGEHHAVAGADVGARHVGFERGAEGALARGGLVAVAAQVRG